MRAQAFVFSAKPYAGEHAGEVAFPGDRKLLFRQHTEKR